MSELTRLRSIIGSILLLVTSVSLSAQSPSLGRTVAGSVRDSAGVAVGNALVVVTQAVTFATQTTTSDSLGAFLVRFPDGAADFLVRASKPGLRATSARVIARAGTDSAFTTILLLAGTQTLASVRVQSTRPRAQDLSQSLGARGGASEAVVSQQTGGLSPYDRGDLEAIAQQSVLLSAGSSGLTALGTTAEQSRVTLSGLAADGLAIPADIRRTVRVTTTQYDPSIGGFSGSITGVEIARGSSLTTPNLRLSTEGERGLSGGGTAFNPANNQRFGLNYAQSGALSSERWSHNSGVTVRQTLRTATPFDLSAAGTAMSAFPLELLDAVRANAQRTGTQSSLDTPEKRTSEYQIDALTRVDRTNVGGRGGLAFIGAVSSGRSDPNADPRRTMSTALASARSLLLAQILATKYTSKGSILDAKIGASERTFRDSPVAIGPTMTITSGIDESLDSFGSLSWGGAGRGSSRERQRRVEGGVTFDTRYTLARGGSHQIRYVLQSEMSDREIVASTGAGRAEFASTEQIREATPTTFIRTLTRADTRGQAANIAIGIGDHWRPTRFLSIQGAARVDFSGGGRQDLAPELRASNLLLPAVASGFSAVPQVSPRIGFVWNYLHQSSDDASSIVSRLGTMSFPGDGQLRGGIGYFQSWRQTSDYLSDRSMTGGGSTLRLECFEGNAPRVEAWPTDASLPTTCTDGTGVYVQPRSRAYTASGAPPGAWRANLAWAKRYKRFQFELTATASLAVRQPVFRDYNLLLEPQFALASEAFRPNYRASPTINPLTGSYTTAVPRRVTTLGSISFVEPTGKAEAMQLAATIVPLRVRGLTSKISTAVTSTRRYNNAFAGTSLEHPAGLRWSTAVGVPAIRTLVELGHSSRRIGVSALLRIDAGARFSPTVNGDVNGDGSAGNDLAFVPPFRDGSDSVSRALRSLTESTSRVGSCLTGSIGRVSSVGACRAPVDVQSAVAISLFPKSSALVRRGGARGTYTMRFENVAGLVDAMLFGRRNHWGLTGPVQTDLYSITGFNRSQGAFTYRVNEAFGRRSSWISGQSAYRVSIDAQFYLGRSIADQEAVRVLRTSRAAKVQSRGTDSIMISLRQTFREPFGVLLENSDSLLLQRAQIEVITGLQRRSVAKTDSIWTAVSRALVEGGDRVSNATRGERLQSAYTAVIAVLQDAVQPLRQILLPQQIERAPGDVKVLLERGQPLFIVR